MLETIRKNQFIRICIPINSIYGACIKQSPSANNLYETFLDQGPQFDHPCYKFYRHEI